MPEKLSYRLITGPDDRSFCERISAALEDGYELAGSPAITRENGQNYVAQAVILKHDRGSSAIARQTA